MGVETMTKKTSKHPQNFWDLGNPVLAMMVDTDAPAFVFQPMKFVALGQIHTMTLLNRRMQACAALPQQWMSCRSPQDVFETNLRFMQGAMRDYSNAIQQMTNAWDTVVEEQSSSKPVAPENHDYMTLAKSGGDDDADTPSGQAAAAEQPRSNGAARAD